jgi:hypothetical protein
MNQLTLHQFLVALGWTESMKDKLTKYADRDEVNFLVAFRTGDKLTASAFTDLPTDLPDNAIAYWSKRPIAEASKSKTMQALELVNQGMTRYAAAKQVGISESAVHRAFYRRKNKPVCPSCNQVIRHQTVD